jgi:hypothetical protein
MPGNGALPVVVAEAVGARELEDALAAFSAAESACF